MDNEIIKMVAFKPSKELRLQLNDNFFALLKLALSDIKRLGRYIRNEIELEPYDFNLPEDVQHERYSLRKLVEDYDSEIYSDLLEAFIDATESYKNGEGYETEKYVGFENKYGKGSGKPGNDYTQSIAETHKFEHFRDFINETGFCD
jgi:hypothetical protein